MPLASFNKCGCIFATVASRLSNQIRKQRITCFNATHTHQLCVHCAYAARTSVTDHFERASISIRWYFLIFHRSNYVFYTTHKHLLIARCPLPIDCHAQSCSALVCSAHIQRTCKSHSSHTEFQFVFGFFFLVSLLLRFFLFFFLNLFVFLCIDRWSHLDLHLALHTFNTRLASTRASVHARVYVCKHLERSDAKVTEFIIKFWFFDSSWKHSIGCCVSVSSAWARASIREMT